MESKLVNIGGVKGNFSNSYVSEQVCGMEKTETHFFSTIFDHSKDIFERNEFVYEQFESLSSKNKIDDLKKILDSSALLDAHGSIIKTLVILSSGNEKLRSKAEELNQYLIGKYGH